MKSTIVYVLQRKEEKVTWFTNRIFKKTIFDDYSFNKNYPISSDLTDKYDIDNNQIWGQMSAHIRIFFNLPKQFDIIGFGQYRRTFCSSNKFRSLFHFPMSKKEIVDNLKNREAIITSYFIPSRQDTVFERFDSFRGGSTYIIKRIISRYPELEETINEMSSSKGGYWNGPNIIARRNYLVQYYEKLIPFLFDCYDFFVSDESKDVIKNRKRYLDFCAELFFAVYFYSQRQNVCEVPYIQYNASIPKQVLGKIKKLFHP